jgi:hypothetical protein
LVICFVSFAFGCAQGTDLSKAKEYAQQSSEYFARATAAYKELIKSGKDPDKFNFELGSLYYTHGKFSDAVDCLNKTNLQEAKKLLAISYYHLGNFTDALSVFNKQNCPDDECRYYLALTCEKLNLFELALKEYALIKTEPGFMKLAAEHSNQIEKQAGSGQAALIDLETERLRNLSVSQENYPEAGAVILLADESIEVSKEGAQVSYMHYVIKILNERGKEEFAETQIGYDSTYEKVILESARTIRPDGVVVEVGSRHIRDVSRYMNFPLYSNARAYIISFPEVVEGAILEYKVKITNNYLINGKDFVLNYPVQATNPVLSARLNLQFPKSTTVHLKILNEKYNFFGATLKPEIQEKGEFLHYSWSFLNIPQIIPEPNMPAGVQINPTILLSTFDDWQEIYTWWRSLSKDKIKADADIKAKVKDLIVDASSREAKAASISNYCAKYIRYVAVEYGQAGYEPHSAADIFKNKYGDCKDQAILLVTMLREAGITAWPVLIPTREDYNLSEDFPSTMFNHCIAALSLDGKIIFMDPTAETCSFQDLPPDDQGRRVLVFQDDGYKIKETPLFEARHNLVKQVLKLKINDDGTISAHKDNYSSGAYDQMQRFWLTYTQPELIAQMLKEKIQEVSIGARLLKYNIENLDDLNKPVALSYDFIGPEYTSVAGNLRIMPQLASVDTSLVAKDSRLYDTDFVILDIRENIFEIELPPGFKVKYLPESINKDSSWVKFEASYECSGKNIFFKQRSETKKNIIPDSEYNDFKKFIEEVALAAKKNIVLEKAEQ